LQQQLDRKGIPLQVLPGADVRIEDDMIEGLRRGDVLSLGDHRKHVLLELPHELYFPLEPVLDQLNRGGMTGILSHPERNQGLLKRPEVVETLVEKGCLMQVTAGSLIGGMGPGPQRMSEWMLELGLVHFLATDAHGPKSRRPLIWRAFERVVELTDRETAVAICCDNPGRVADGKPVAAGRRRNKAKRSVISDWFTWRKAG
jgi:protein-tyrosine phosphatase